MGMAALGAAKSLSTTRAHGTWPLGLARAHRQPARRGARSIARLRPASDEPPIWLRLHLSLAQEHPAAVGRHDENVAAGFDQRAKCQAVLPVSQEQLLSRVMAGDELWHDSVRER